MPRSICFVGHLMLPLLTGREDAIVGGVEIQTYHLAAEMRRRGWEVSFLVCGKEESPRQMVETPLGPARILYAPTPRRSFGEKLRDRLRVADVIRQLRCDVLFQRAAWDAETSLLSARLSHKRSVYCVASDRDAIALPRLSRRRLILRLADSVVAQSADQRDWLRRYGCEAQIIPAAFPIPDWGNHNREEILWIGTLRALRGAEIFLDLAEALPRYRFVVCSGAQDDVKLTARLRRRAERLGNVRFEGFVPYPRLHDYLRRARVLVSTSRHEGFPSSFVLAWLHGAVVVSLTVDPQGLLSRRGLGLVGSDPFELLQCLQRVVQDEHRQREIAARARAYAETQHDVRHIGTAYEELFERILGA